MAVSGAVKPPRLENLLELEETLQKPFVKRTLHGCLLFLAGDTLTICREPAACTKNTLKGAETLWDGRFLLNGTVKNIKPLGILGWQQIKETEMGAALRPLPYPVRLTMPCVWDNDTVVSMASGVWVTQNTLARTWLEKYIELFS
jgi:hypothetical protein